MSNLNEISPAELVADLLSRWGDPERDVVVGPATDAQQQRGVVQMVSAGLPLVEKYAPLQWCRAQVRCLHGSMSEADSIGQSVQRDIHGLVRKRARMSSTDKWYLVHLCNITAGPSQHYDSPETHEVLLFAEIMLGSTPLDPSDFG